MKPSQHLLLLLAVAMLITSQRQVSATTYQSSVDPLIKFLSNLEQFDSFAEIYKNVQSSIPILPELSTNKNEQPLQVSELSDLTPWYQNFLTCTVCQSITEAVLDNFKDQKLVKAIEGGIGLYCYFYYYGNETCVYLIKNAASQYFDYGFTLVVTPHYLCSQVVSICATEFSYLTTQDYITDVLSDKPSTITSDNYVQALYDGIKGETGRSNYVILHISDPQIDYLYETGADTGCNELLCCRSKYGSGDSQTYGHLNCGTPLASLNLLIDAVQAQYTPDMVFITGGMTARDLTLENTTVQTYLNTTLKALKTQFPSTQMFFSLGEEEFLPTFAENFTANASWTLGNISASIQYGLGTLNSTAANESTQYGYYSVMNIAGSNVNTATLSSTMLLSLNTQACYTYNLGLMQELNDTAGQLGWLEGKLQYAEDNNLTIFIIGHIPPGNEKCNRQWNERYHALMERYQHIVRLQAFGHEGTDSFKIQRSNDTSTPFNVLQVGGSAATYSMNPSVRLYVMDASLHIPTEIKVLTFDVDYPNANPSSTWTFTSKSYPTSYGMIDLSPSEYSGFVSKIESTSATATSYISDMTKTKTTTCDSDCQLQLYCSLNYGLVEKTLQCRNKAMDFYYYGPYILSTLENPWVEEV